MAELKHKDITEKIIGASFDVHSFLGNGFQEVIYQRALEWEMKQRDLSFIREIEQDIFYKDLPKPIGTRRADFVVENKILVELKAIYTIRRRTPCSSLKLSKSLQIRNRATHQLWKQIPNF